MRIKENRRVTLKLHKNDIKQKKIFNLIDKKMNLISFILLLVFVLFMITKSSVKVLHYFKVSKGV